MDSTVIDIEPDGEYEEGQASSGVRSMSVHLAAFFTNPLFDDDDYADAFLMFLGEDLDVCIPQGQLRGYQNTYADPVHVIERSLRVLLERIRVGKPDYSEGDLAAHINWFLTHEEGYIEARISRVARASPYNGKVLPQKPSAKDDENIMSHEAVGGNGHLGERATTTPRRK